VDPTSRERPDNGVTQEELIETITHLAFYAGWPNAITAITVAKDVLETRRAAPLSEAGRGPRDPHGDVQD
jgi:hypothetical protein